MSATAMTVRDKRELAWQMPARAPGSPLPVAALAFLLAHVPLALLMRQQSLIATVHAVAAVGIGVAMALGGRIERPVYVLAYIAGAEVLWRACHAHVFWEFGKYASATVLIVMLARVRPVRWPWMPLIYFLLLLPSVLYTILEVGLVEARQRVSFNVSGPLTLALSAWALSHVVISPGRLRMLTTAFMGPVVSMATLALVGLSRASSLSFVDESNRAASGGFGPNQVSAIFGLAAFLGFLVVIDRAVPIGHRVLMVALTLLFAGQSVLTFSRGGGVTAAAAAVVALGLLWWGAGARRGTVIAAVVMLLLGGYLLWPRLDAFTGGKLSERFHDLSTSGREGIVRDDIRIWLDHPIFGVGPGGARLHRENDLGAHTEYSRLVAEHGIFGLGALAVLFGMSLQRVRRARGSKERALVGSLLAWSLLDMLHSAMRIVAPSFAFGLAFARFITGSVVAAPRAPPPAKRDETVRVIVAGRA